MIGKSTLVLEKNGKMKTGKDMNKIKMKKIISKEALKDWKKYEEKCRASLKYMQEHPSTWEEMLEQKKMNEEIRKQNMMENEKNSLKDPLTMTAEEYLEDMKEEMKEDEKLTEEELNRKYRIW